MVGMVEASLSQLGLCFVSVHFVCLLSLEELKNKMNEGQQLSSRRLMELEKRKKNKRGVNAEMKKFNAELNAKKREITGTSILPGYKSSISKTSPFCLPYINLQLFSSCPISRSCRNGRTAM